MQKLKRPGLNNLKNLRASLASFARAFYKNENGELDENSLGWHRVLLAYVEQLAALHRDNEISKRMDNVEQILHNKGLM